MSEIRLDLSSFEKAILQLESSLDYCNSTIANNDCTLKLHLRAGAIQAFKFTYELSWKMLKRYLEVTAPNPQEIDEMSFSDLIRSGCEQGLLLSELKNMEGI